MRNRTVAETRMNRHSSRSHSVFSLHITSKKDEHGVTVTRRCKLNMVDLAGSERQTKTGSTGLRLIEANCINQSLSTLGNVITALVDVSWGKKRHIPYRDSKLTFLLKVKYFLQFLFVLFFVSLFFFFFFFFLLKCGVDLENMSRKRLVEVL